MEDRRGPNYKTRLVGQTKQGYASRTRQNRKRYRWDVPSNRRWRRRSLQGQGESRLWGGPYFYKLTEGQRADKEGGDGLKKGTGLSTWSTKYELFCNSENGGFRRARMKDWRKATRWKKSGGSEGAKERQNNVKITKPTKEEF